MKREIKFRAWDGEIMELSDDDLHGFFKWCAYNNYTEPIMQYTGLTDKNGKEIYEGDIFQVANNKEYIVQYTEGDESNFEWHGGCFILYSSDELFFPFDKYAMKHGKVIGNIYETPNLLTP